VGGLSGVSILEVSSSSRRLSAAPPDAHIVVSCSGGVGGARETFMVPAEVADARDILIVSCIFIRRALHIH
jgi:hypothetical protein